MNNMNTNGKIWKWTTGILAGVILSLIGIIYGGLIKNTDAIAEDLETHKTIQGQSDLNMAATIAGLKEKVENTDKNVSEILNRLNRIGIK